MSVLAAYAAICRRHAQVAFPVGTNTCTPWTGRWVGRRAGLEYLEIASNPVLCSP